MDTFGRMEQIGICQLLQHSLRQLRILGLNPTNNDLLDPAGVYSIGELLEQQISHLENFHQNIEQADPEKNGPARKSLTVSQDSNGDDMFNYWQFSKLCMEIKALHANLTGLEKTYVDLHHQLHERKQLEIARNRFVGKWESTRREQLVQCLTLRSESFRKETDRQELEVESGLRTARQINDFYDWQLTKVETDIGDWMDRFDREKEQVDYRHQKARAKIRRWDEMKVEIEKMNGEIAELEQIETEYVKEAEHKRMCQKYAVKLQAWWRGVMVRKGFGPFAKSKKSKGKKKAKGAKSKTKKTKKSKK